MVHNKCIQIQNNMLIMIGNKTDEMIKKLVQPLLTRFK